MANKFSEMIKSDTPTLVDFLQNGAESAKQ